MTKNWVKCGDMWINMDRVDSVLVNEDGTLCVLFASDLEGPGLTLKDEQARAMQSNLERVIDEPVN